MRRSKRDKSLRGRRKRARPRAGVRMGEVGPFRSRLSFLRCYPVTRRQKGMHAYPSARHDFQRPNDRICRRMNILSTLKSVTRRQAIKIVPRRFRLENAFSLSKRNKSRRRGVNAPLGRGAGRDTVKMDIAAERGAPTFSRAFFLRLRVRSSSFFARSRARARDPTHRSRFIFPVLRDPSRESPARIALRRGGSPPLVRARVANASPIRQKKNHQISIIAKLILQRRNAYDRQVCCASRRVVFTYKFFVVSDGYGMWE